ncbi:uncharacterized protein PHA67_008892 isoform 1-T1 [Liasis olivaceus]
MICQLFPLPTKTMDSHRVKTSRKILLLYFGDMVPKKNKEGLLNNIQTKDPNDFSSTTFECLLKVLKVCSLRWLPWESPFILSLSGNSLIPLGEVWQTEDVSVKAEPMIVAKTKELKLPINHLKAIKDLHNDKFEKSSSEVLASNCVVSVWIQECQPYFCEKYQVHQTGGKCGLLIWHSNFLPSASQDYREKKLPSGKTTRERVSDGTKNSITVATNKDVPSRVLAYYLSSSFLSHPMISVSIY